MDGLIKEKREGGRGEMMGRWMDRWIDERGKERMDR